MRGTDLAKTGTIKLYIGGEWHRKVTPAGIEHVWLRGKRLMSKQYYSIGHRKAIVKEWEELFAVFEVGIIPYHHLYNENEAWSGREAEMEEETVGCFEKL